MTRLLRGKRIARNARLRLGCSATLFDSTRQRILLTCRNDNHLWCLPGGGMDAGETVEETCIREMREETGLNVCVVRLIGVYSSPDLIIEYRDGNRFQMVALNFEVEEVGGELGLSDETCDCGYFSLEEIRQLNLMEHHWQRILDAFTPQSQPYLR